MRKERKIKQKSETSQVLHYKNTSSTKITKDSNKIKRRKSANISVFLQRDV